MAYLPMLLMLVVTPVVAWFVLGHLNKKPETGDDAVKEEKIKGPGAPSRLAVPVIPGPLDFYKGNPKKGEFPRIANTNDIVANKTELEEMIITLADNRTAHNAVLQVFVIGEDTDEIMRRINLSRLDAISFFERVTNLVSSKLFSEVQTPGFRNILRDEIKLLSNEVLGSNIVQEVVISKFLSK